LKYLLDTNIISEFVSKKPNQKVLDYINSLDENDIYLSVCLAKGFVLITRNEKDFYSFEIEMVNPF